MSFVIVKIVSSSLFFHRKSLNENFLLPSFKFRRGSYDRRRSVISPTKKILFNLLFPLEKLLTDENEQFKFSAHGILPQGWLNLFVFLAFNNCVIIYVLKCELGAKLWDETSRLFRWVCGQDHAADGDEWKRRFEMT